MADLLVHYAVGHLGGKATARRDVRWLFVIGNFIPDIVYKAFLYGTHSDKWYCEPSHSPLALIVICLLAAHLFEESLRPAAFWAMLLGSICHVFIDAFKSYMGHGVILWGFPFSMDRFEFGVIQTVDTVYLMGPGLGVILLTELIGRIRSARRLKS